MLVLVGFRPSKIYEFPSRCNKYVALGFRVGDYIFNYALVCAGTVGTAVITVALQENYET